MDLKTVERNIGEIKSAVTEMKKNAKTTADLKERMDNLEPKFDEFDKALKAMPQRQGKYVVTDNPSDKGADAVVGKGVSSLAGIRKLSAYKRTSDGFLANRMGDPVQDICDDGADALTLHDEVYIAHTLASNFLPGYNDTVGKNRGEIARKEFIHNFPSLGRRWDEFMKSFREKATTLTTGGSGTGSDWIPTGFAASLFDDIRIQTPEMNIFRVVPQPTKNWTYPVKGAVGGASIRTEGTAPTAVVHGTSSVTLAAKTFISYQEFTDEMDQDSIISVLPAVRADIIRSLSEGFSVAAVRGDTTTTHMHNDIESDSLGAAHCGAAFDGLEHYGLVDQTSSVVNVSGGSISYADIGSGLKTMGKYAAGRTGDVVVLIGPKKWAELLVEASSPITTVDKYGSNATIVSGEMGRIYGARVVLSHGVGESEDNVAADGKNTATAAKNTFCNIVMVNRNLWIIGDRQDIRIETDRNIAAGETQVVGTARWSFQKFINAASKYHTVVLYNML